MNKEVWEPVSGFPGYEVSTYGNIRSWRHKNGRLGKPKLLKPILTEKGYRKVCLQSKIGQKNRRLCRLVLETFKGKRPEGMECRHLDGNPANDNITNLAWGTSKENSADTKKHGNQVAGSIVPSSKLTEKDVTFMRKNRHLSRKELALRYGVNVTTIDRARNNRSWKHVL